jgi:hypothetical protein
MRRFAFVALVIAAALLALLAASAAVVDAFPDKLIRCKVCHRAVAHVWSRARDLRHHCRTESTDRRCDYDGIHPHAIDQMVWGVCEALPKTHQAVHESEFDLVVAQDPLHSEEAIAAIKNSCVRWLHMPHTVESIGRLIHDNLKVGKGDNVLKSMQEHFCYNACQLPEPSADL